MATPLPSTTMSIAIQHHQLVDHIFLLTIILFVYTWDTVKFAEFSHTAKRYPLFQLVLISSTNTNSTPPPNHLISPWQPQLHYETNSSLSLTWILDIRASHHVTYDLTNLSLHTPYNGLDDIMIVNGSSLSITHTGSISFTTTSQHNFQLNIVLCVLAMKKNLISMK
jgi:hypothetical protein